MPAATSWPSKRRIRSICCWRLNGRKSGEVASRFLSRRSRANWSSARRASGARPPAPRGASRAELEDVGLVDHLHRRRAGLRGQQRHLAEQRALVQARALGLPAPAVGREDAHLAGADQVEGHAGLALADDDSRRRSGGAVAARATPAPNTAAGSSEKNGSGRNCSG